MGQKKRKRKLEDEAEAEPEREAEPVFDNKFKKNAQNPSPSSADCAGKKQKHNYNDTIPEPDDPSTPLPVSKKQDTLTTPLTTVTKAKDNICSTSSLSICRSFCAYHCPPSTGDHEDSKKDVAYAEPQKLTAARVLFDQHPRTGGIYDNLKFHRLLEEVPKSDPTIDVGREMADSVHILKLISSSKPVIDIAGEKVDEGAMLLQEGEKLVTGAQYILRSAINDLSNLLH